MDQRLDMPDLGDFFVYIKADRFLSDLTIQGRPAHYCKDYILTQTAVFMRKVDGWLSKSGTDFCGLIYCPYERVSLLRGFYCLLFFPCKDIITKLKPNIFFSMKDLIFFNLSKYGKFLSLSIHPFYWYSLFPMSKFSVIQ